jgi:hypothetical protein
MKYCKNQQAMTRKSVQKWAMTSRKSIQNTATYRAFGKKVNDLSGMNKKLSEINKCKKEQ